MARKTLRRLDDMVRSHLLKVDTYSSMDAPEILAQKAGISPNKIIKLNGNENPFGPSPKAVEAVANVDFHIYPDPNQEKMREALSGYTGLGPEKIVVGAGADELIDLLFRLFISPGEIILDFDPTFGMYSFCAGVSGAKVEYIDRDENFDIDVEAALSRVSDNTKMIFVTSPNNPTGNPVREDQVLELLKSGLIVVVDEAYFEFSGSTMQNLVGDYKNLIILRTMSKWAGLAGLRVGYGLMHEEVANYLMDIKPPYNVNIAGEAALVASLEDSEYLLSNVRKIVLERDRMYRLLDDIYGVKPWPSEGNYILCQFNENRAGKVYEALASRGIFVRNFPSKKLRDFFRIAVGMPDETSLLVKSVEEIMREIENE